MTSLTFILLVLSVICSSVAIHLQKECETKSELEISYEWSTIDINVWMPRGDLSCLTIEIEFESYIFPKFYDSIEVFGNNIKVEFIRNGIVQTDQHNMNETIPEGWTDIILSLESSYGLTYRNHNISLPRKSIDDFFPKLIRLKGSNVTINCPLGQRMWKISDKRVYLPIDSSEPQNFYVFSVREFLPNMFIESRKIPLGYADGKYTTIESTAQKLPASSKHDLVITCHNEKESICNVKLGSVNVTEDNVKVGHIPRSISFTSNFGGSFYVIQDSRSIPFDLETTTKIEISHETTCLTTDPWQNTSVIGVTVFLALLLVVSICFNVIQKMRTSSRAHKRHIKKNSESETGLVRKVSYQSSEGDSTEAGLLMAPKCSCKHENEISKNDESEDFCANLNQKSSGHNARMRSKGKKQKNKKQRMSTQW